MSGFKQSKRQAKRANAKARASRRPGVKLFRYPDPPPPSLSLQKKHEAVQDVVRLIEECGVHCEVPGGLQTLVVGPSATLSVAGSLVTVAEATLRSVRERREWVEDLFASELLSLFRDRIELELAGTGLEARGLRDGRFVVITDPSGNEVGIVGARHAQALGGRWLRGGFAGAGAHWREFLAEIAAQGLTLTRTGDDGTSQGPVPLAGPALRLAELASRDIRTSRYRAFGAPVALVIDGSERVVFMPVEERMGALMVPFEYLAAGVRVSGAMRLNGPTDLLEVSFVRNVDAVPHGYITGLAVCGFAQLTTVPLPRIVRRVEGSHPSTGRRELSFGPSRPARLRAAPALVVASRYGTVVAERRVVERLAGSVAGHRRRLTEGQSCSSEARERARSVGIDLMARETWVRPHTRGAEVALGLLEMPWEPPTEIRSAASGANPSPALSHD